jgi:hypothetical protein
MVASHPSYILRGRSNRSKRMIWEDLLKVMERADLPISARQRALLSGRVKRRLPPLLGFVLLLAPLMAVAAAEDRVTFESLRDRAKALAAEPPRERGSVPDWIRKLTYDQFRLIEFDAANTIWRREGLPFQLQFFHPGFVHDRVVSVHELNSGVAAPIPFVRQLFNYQSLKPARSHRPWASRASRFYIRSINPPTNSGPSLGASYFRLLCKKSAYGLSARGIAVNTRQPQAGGEVSPVHGILGESPGEQCQGDRNLRAAGGPQRHWRLSLFYPARG